MPQDKETHILHILHKTTPEGVTNLYTEEFVQQQQAEIEALKDDKLKYAEAVVEALEWGSYAGDYFQQKHGWHEDVAKWNDIVSILRKAQ